MHPNKQDSEIVAVGSKSLFGSKSRSRAPCLFSVMKIGTLSAKETQRMAQAAHKVLGEFYGAESASEVLRQEKSPSGDARIRAFVGSWKWHSGLLLQAFVGPCLSDGALMQCANVNPKWRRKISPIQKFRKFRQHVIKEFMAPSTRRQKLLKRRLLRLSARLRLGLL